MVFHTRIIQKLCFRGKYRFVALTSRSVTTYTDNSNRIFPPAKYVTDAAHVASMEDYRSLYKLSLTDPDVFWKTMVERFYWKKKPEPPFLEFNFNVEKGPVFVKWFENGQTNICYNALDRNVEKGLGAKIAFHWEGTEPGVSESISYKDLHSNVCKFANALKKIGVKCRDHVAIYMPVILEAAVAMLACSRIGAIHTVVFGGFSEESLSFRMLHSKCKVLVTADGYYRGSKFINLLKIAQGGLDICSRQGLDVICIVINNLQRSSKHHSLQMSEVKNKYISWQSIAKDISDNCDPQWMNACESSFLLYTSGSTGQPKGIIHSVGGYMVFAGTTHHYVFDNQPDDVHWCTADIGWVMGHTFGVYGPLLNSSTGILFEGNLLQPNPYRTWEIVDKYKVTKFYTSPTAIRAFMKFEEPSKKCFSLESLKILGTAGEPINPNAWSWYHRVIGKERCPVLDTFWQTETGGPLLCPLPGAIPLIPGSATVPFFGVDPLILDDEGNETKTGEKGHLLLRSPLPGMCIGIQGSYDRFEEIYFRRFPGAHRDARGYYWISGRTDDMLNVSGHLLSTAEVEQILTDHSAIIEAAVVSRPHPIKGECLYCFVVLAKHLDDGQALIEELKYLVKSKIGAFAVPDSIQISDSLPKTRSGKVMRRILRKIVCGDSSYGDICTLEDPSVIESLKANILPEIV